MTNPIADPGHGHSPAAWTAVVIMLVGVAAGTVAFCFEQPALVVASVALIRSARSSAGCSRRPATA